MSQHPRERARIDQKCNIALLIGLHSRQAADSEISDRP
jgi:hypothetical protein